MIGYLTMRLAGSGDVLPVLFRSTGVNAPWQQANLIACDAAGVILVSQGNETTAIPWGNVAALEVVEG